MKSKKLIKLGRRKRFKSELDWIDSKKAELEQLLNSGDGDLLTLSFPEWCQTLKIKTDKGLQPFELFPWQEKTADLIVGPKPLTRRAIALLSSRQTGKTSLMLAIAAYLAQSRRQFTAVIIHRTTQDAHLLCRRVKRFLSGVQLKTDSLSLLEFAATDSAIHFRSSNPSKSDGAEQVGRGLESVDFVLVEEASHTANLKDVLGVIAPALTWSAMGLVTFVGTASSKQSYYYENLATAAEGGENLENLLSGIREGQVEPFQILDRGKGAVGVVTNWRAIERFKQEPNFLCRVQEEFDLSDTQMDSEYELIFGSDVNSAVFSFSLIMAAQSEEIEPYSEPGDEIIYLGIDPAGQGRDFAVCVGIRECRADGKQHFEVCDIYRKRSGVSEQHLNAISQRIQRLQPIAATVEKNSMGQVWLENLSGMGLHCDINGFSTTASSKEVLIGRLQIALERGVLKIPKGPIIDELLAYRRTDKGKLEAGGNANDDTVIALALALHSARFNR